MTTGKTQVDCLSPTMLMNYLVQITILKVESYWCEFIRTGCRGAQWNFLEMTGKPGGWEGWAWGQPVMMVGTACTSRWPCWKDQVPPTRSEPPPWSICGPSCRSPPRQSPAEKEKWSELEFLSCTCEELRANWSVKLSQTGKDMKWI